MLQIIPNEERLELFESDFPKLKHELEVQHIEIMMQLRENENIIEELLNSNKMLSDLNEKMKVKELELANKNNQLQSSLQKNIDKEHFISILAHDLKAPLNTVIGFLELLTENVDEYDINTFKTQLNIINKSAKNLDNLLESILMWGISES